MPALSIYGSAKIVKKVYQRVWKRRKDGVRQRYRKVAFKRIGKTLEKRFTFWSEDYHYIVRARKIMIQQRLVPKSKFEDRIDAKRFCNDKKYRESITRKGDWVEFEIKET